jgi:hypothetical protein
MAEKCGCREARDLCAYEAVAANRYFCGRTLASVDQLKCSLAQVYFGSSGSPVQTTTTLPFSQSATLPSSRRKPRSYPSRLSAACQSAEAQVFIGLLVCFASRSQ